MSCSARAQNDYFQDTIFSIASGFTLASLRDCSYTRQRFSCEILKPLASVAPLLLSPPKHSDLLEHTIHRFFTLSHPADLSAAAVLRSRSTF